MSIEKDNKQEELTRQEEVLSNITGKAKGYLNGHSKIVFRIMVGLIVVSIIAYVIRFSTREKAEISIQNVYENVKRDASNSFGLDQIEYERYTKYMELEKELDQLIDKEILTSSDSIRIRELYKEINNMQ